jgi:hypothetical protein
LLVKSSGNSPAEARPSDPLVPSERDHLSPADALHVRPLPPDQPPQQPQQHQQPIVLTSNELPRGFQMTGFTPSGMHMDVPPEPMPAAYSPINPADRAAIVIPSFADYAGLGEPESESESVSSSMSRKSADTLTTPPGRNARSLYSNGTYAAGRPLPPSTPGSVSGRTNRTEKTNYTAARVPLPASVAGSVSGRTERTDFTGARVPLPPSTPGSISGRTNRTAADVPLPASVAGSVSGRTNRSTKSRR